MLYFFTTLAIGHFPSLDSYCEFFQIFSIHFWLEEINAMARASCVPTRFIEMADLTRREIADCRAMLSSWQRRETTTGLLQPTSCSSGWMPGAPNHPLAESEMVVASEMINPPFEARCV